LNEHQVAKFLQLSVASVRRLAAVSHWSNVFEDRRCRSISAGSMSKRGSVRAVSGWIDVAMSHRIVDRR
jgi:hypothetical protein